jgi:hypothetical protein
MPTGYTSSKAQAGRTASISIGAVPTLIGECDQIPVQRGAWKMADVTNFESGSDAEYLPTIRDGAKLEITGNRVSSDAGQTAVEAAYQSGALTAFTVALPKTATQTTTGDSITFNAYVMESTFTVDLKDAIKFKISLQVSGPMDMVEGS